MNFIGPRKKLTTRGCYHTEILCEAISFDVREKFEYFSSVRYIDIPFEKKMVKTLVFDFLHPSKDWIYR